GRDTAPSLSQSCVCTGVSKQMILFQSTQCILREGKIIDMPQRPSVRRRGIGRRLSKHKIDRIRCICGRVRSEMHMSF
ncbi:unnamed protein product, partial [Mycena citricolor]